VIPHIARLLVHSLNELTSYKLIIVGHHYPSVDAFLIDTGTEVIDLADQHRISPQRVAPATRIRGVYDEDKCTDSQFEPGLGR
jgi:hypothetical protein